jgi:hypothetical protein
VFFVTEKASILLSGYVYDIPPNGHILRVPSIENLAAELKNPKRDEDFRLRVFFGKAT